MKVGFTGTRHGLTTVQRLSLIAQLRIMRPTEFHHGDCVGSDAESAEIVASLFGGEIVRVHPPVDDEFRAFTKWGFAVSETKTHFARNRDIVAACDVLMATPIDNAITKSTMGGTAYTVNYARKLGKPVVILWPSGSVTNDRVA